MKELAPNNERYSDIEQRVIADLFDVGGIRLENTRFKVHEERPDLPLSPIYIDLRMLGQNPALLKYTIDAYAPIIEGILLSSSGFPSVSPIPDAAVPIGALLSQRFNTKLLPPRLKEKNYGRNNAVNGYDDAKDRGRTTIVIDDVVTQAGSKLKAIEVLERTGLVVKDIVVLVDYEFGAKKILAEKGYNLKSVLTISKILRFLRQINKISEREYKEKLGQLSALSEALS